MNDYDEGNEPYTYNARLRYIIFFALLIVAAIYVLSRYAHLMVNSDALAGETDGVSTERGAIFDRNGKILAMETRFANIGLWRPAVGDGLPTIAALLSTPLQMSPEALIERVESAPSDFVYIKKRVEQNVFREIEQLKSEKGLLAVRIDPVMGRVYPEQKLAAPLIGFVGDDNTGLAGIEYAFNSELASNNIFLTIDANIQYILEGIAQKALDENVAESVMLLAMDPRTGDMLGAASLPSFDPNNFGSSTDEERMFRPAVWAYEPGSVFKVFSIAGLLNDGAITPSSVFFCNGEYDVISSGGEHVVIKCLGSHGEVHARQIITYSCNAGAAYASDNEREDAFYETIRSFGFGERTASGFAGETAGFLRPPSRWSVRTKPTIAIGQEIAVSAMQMLKAATAVASDGTLRTPRLVGKIVAEDGSRTTEYQVAPPVKLLNESTARELRSYMQDVTSGFGTGWRAFIEDIPMSVKTGTAQMIDSETNAYSDTDFIASCMAILPAASPSLVIYIAIIKPKGESYLGGRIASPYIREAAEALVDYMGIPRGRNPQVSHTGQIPLPRDDTPYIGDTMPNLIGYSKRQLLPLLSRTDLHFRISGEGWVKTQSPPQGTRITSDTTIELTFE